MGLLSPPASVDTDPRARPWAIIGIKGQARMYEIVGLVDAGDQAGMVKAVNCATEETAFLPPSMVLAATLVREAPGAPDAIPEAA